MKRLLLSALPEQENLTILNLIGRYFDIQKGQILIDGIDIHEIDLNVLRGAIGQVQQDVFIFTGDIKSNISLNNEAISRTMSDGLPKL